MKLVTVIQESPGSSPGGGNEARHDRSRCRASPMLGALLQRPVVRRKCCPPECLFQPPSHQMPTDRLVRPLPLSGMGKEQGAADSALLLPKSSA